MHPPLLAASASIDDPLCSVSTLPKTFFTQMLMHLNQHSKQQLVSTYNNGKIARACPDAFVAVLCSRYYGPSYIIPNTFNSSERWPLNWWFYNDGACKRMYEESQKILKDLNEQLAGVRQSPAGNHNLVGLRSFPLTSADSMEVY